MEINVSDIDMSRLRSDLKDLLKDYYGTAKLYFPIAEADLVNVESMIDSLTDMGVIQLADEKGIDILEYVLHHKSK